MNLDLLEIILILFVSLLSMAIPLAALIGVILIYRKFSRIEERLEQLEEEESKQ